MVSAAPTDTPANDRGQPPSDPLTATADARAATFGRVLALMMASPRHSTMTLAEANASIAPPLALGQIAMMGAKAVDGGPVALAAAAWWAYVSPEVDQRLTASREPHMKLLPNEWNSGDQPWIIEALGEQRLVSELIKTLAEKHFIGKPAKLRAVLPDGRVAVGRLEPRPPGAHAPGASNATPGPVLTKA